MLILKKIIDNLSLDFKWLFKTPNSLEKFLYFPRKYFAIVFNKRKIKYLGKDFYYDNRFTPAIIQDYPIDIKKLNDKIDFKKISKVLDIGANIGQFSVTLSYYFPDLKIYSFEPNKEIFKILEKNINKNIISNNFGVSNEEKVIDFYYIRGKSAQGSVYKNNSSLGVIGGDEMRGDEMMVKTSIEVLKLTKDKCIELKIPVSYDFVKIDVEGLEKEVLEGISEIDWKFLYIEVSNNRDGKISEEEILEILNKKDGIYKIIYTSKSSENESIYDVIIQKN